MPQAQQIKQKLDELSADFSVCGGKFNKEIKYAGNHWEQLLECLKHGYTKLDTNELENRFRPTAIGKKNWLFVGHPEAGHKGAIIYTLMTNCSLSMQSARLHTPRNPSRQLAMAILIVAVGSIVW